MDISKETAALSTQITYAVIEAIYDGNSYKSIPIKLLDNTNDTRMVLALTESGTTDLTVFKIPLADNKCIIFSRQQLDKTLFAIEIGTHLDPNIKPKKKNKVA